MDRLIKFAMLRPRSEFEIKRWLARKKINDKDSEIALRELKKTELINDKEFAKWWIEQRLTFRPKSRRMLVVELIKHGVDKELALKTVSESGIDDESLVLQLIEKKKRSWEKLDKETRRKKIANFLLTRGFGWNSIKESMKELT